MIPVLFDGDQTSFTTNGIGSLTDCVSAEVTEELNGIYELKMSYIDQGQFADDIEKGKIVTAKANDTSNDQAFRLYRKTKSPLNNRLSIYAQHISYDMIGYPVKPFEKVTTNATVALNLILSNSYYDNLPFSAVSTSSTTSSIEVKIPKSIRACLGGSEGSILDNFGGEFEFDNYVVKHYSKRGNNNGVRISYGKNLSSIVDDTSVDKTYTGIFPYFIKSDDTVVTLSEKVIQTQNLSGYPVPKILNLNLSDKFETDEEKTETNLRTVSNQYLTDNRINSISQNITINFESLWQTDEYANVAPLERVSLGDTVMIDCEELGISVTARVVKTVYDVLNEKYKSIELGKIKSNMGSLLRSMQSDINSLSTKVNSQQSIMDAAIAHATDLITGGLGGYVVIPTNATGYPEEILIMDTPDKTTAVNVWRFNQGGLGHSHTGYNGPFSDIALTSDGMINASRILVGVLNANLIKAGMISDSNNNYQINLDTGHIRLGNGSNNSYADLWRAGFTIYHSNNTVAASMFHSLNDRGVVTAEQMLIGTRESERVDISTTNGVGYVMTDSLIFNGTNATKITSNLPIYANEVIGSKGFRILDPNNNEIGSFYFSSSGRAVLKTDGVYLNKNGQYYGVVYVDSNGTDTVMQCDKWIYGTKVIEPVSIEALCSDGVTRTLHVMCY